MKEEWKEILGTKGEFYRGSITGRVRHKSELWKEEIWNDDWMDVPGYEGLYRMCVYMNHPIIFSIKRDAVLNVLRKKYVLYKNGEKRQFTEKQIMNL